MLMSLFQPPPDTTGYMIAGYAVQFGVMLVYLVSYFVRYKNLKADLEVLLEIENEKIYFQFPSPVKGNKQGSSSDILNVTVNIQPTYNTNFIYLTLNLKLVIFYF